MAHLQTSTLTCRQATVLILVTSRCSLASCDDIRYPNFQGGRSCVTKTFKMAIFASPTEPRGSVVVETSLYLARTCDEKLIRCCDVGVQ
uniref:Secreted protein n=1 Tax=Rhipicephalus appendiculatus TaxID=34631 RepID=A0A131YBL6_RHIAP